MVATNGNPYRSPSKSGGEAKKPTSGRDRFSRVLVAIHFLVTLNWAVAVGWLYSEALHPGYLMSHSPALDWYVAVSVWPSALFLLTPLVVTVCLVPRPKTWSLSLGDLGICLLSFALSGLEVWLFRLVMSPPIHAI